MTDLVDALNRLRDAEARAPARHLPLPLGSLLPVVAGALLGLPRSDWWVPGPREQIGAVLRDVPLERLTSDRAGARPYRVAPVIASPALRAIAAVGLASADPARGALVHLGIGSMASGDAHEAFNLAALRAANVVFVVAVAPLDRAGSPLAQQLAATPADLARAFTLTAVDVDGADAAAVRSAVATARAAGGPHVIVAYTSP